MGRRKTISDGGVAMVVTGETGVTTETVPLVAEAGPNEEQQARNREQFMATAAVQIEMWPVASLADHPDNPRTVRTGSQEFKDLLASIEANGIYEPLTVRHMPAWRR